MSMQYLGKLKKNEQGMAAIFITIILMVVISLIVLGFAQVTRREQRQALDRQLSTQAYYAAESGVNLAQQEIASLYALGITPPAKNDCGEDTDYGDPSVDILNSELEVDAAKGVVVTCLLISSELSSLNYHSVGNESKAVNVESTSNINRIDFSWQASGSSAAAANCTQVPALPSATNWSCNQPLLRVDIVPTAGALLSRAALQASQFTTFLYPSNGGAGTQAYSGGSMSTITQVNCSAAGSAPYVCTGSITGLNATRYGVRIMAIYGTADVNISAQAGGAPATLINGQTVIDSTGKANDVLRRIQVSVSNSSSVADFGIVSGAGLCKRYSFSGGNVSIVGGGASFPACEIN